MNGKKRLITEILLGMILAFMLTACGKKDPLEGAWKRIDYKINQDKQEIEYIESEILFADGRVTKENEILLYELADDGKSVYLGDGSTEIKREFDIKDNSLFFDGNLYYKVDSEECKQYYEETEMQAQAELDELLIRIAEEEALKKAKEEALTTASQLWNNAVSEIIGDLDSAVSDVQDRLKGDVLPILEGIWVRNHPAHTDTYTFTDGTVIQYQDWGFTDETVEGIVKVTLIPYLDFKQFDDERLLNDSLETSYKLDMLQNSCPFNEEWKLEDLQNAETYIEEKFEPFHSQIEDIKNLTYEDFKNNKNVLSIRLTDNGLDFGIIDVSTITQEMMIMVVGSYELELYRQ